MKRIVRESNNLRPVDTAFELGMHADLSAGTVQQNKFDQHCIQLELYSNEWARNNTKYQLMNELELYSKMYAAQV